jgi:hypothetical protein
VGALGHSTILTSALCDLHDSDAPSSVHTEGVTDPDGMMGTTSGKIGSVRPVGLSFVEEVPTALVDFGAGRTEWLQGERLSPATSVWSFSPGPHLPYTHDVQHSESEWYAWDENAWVQLTVGRDSKNTLPAGASPQNSLPESLLPLPSNFWEVAGPCAGRYYAVQRPSEDEYQLVALDPALGLPGTKVGELTRTSTMTPFCDDHGLAIRQYDQSTNNYQFVFYDHEGKFLGTQSPRAESGLFEVTAIADGLLLLVTQGQLLIASPEKTLSVPLPDHTQNFATTANLKGEHLVVLWHDAKRDLLVTEGRILFQ